MKSFFLNTAFALAFLVLSLFIGPKQAFHRPASAAFNTHDSGLMLSTTTHLWLIDADSPEMKRFEKRPVHPAVFDPNFFAPQKSVARVANTHLEAPSNKHPVRPERPHSYYHSLIEKIADQHQVDPALIKAMVKAESSYNPQALSMAGAMGLMQLMPATAEELGVANGFDPEENLLGGIKYYKRLLKRYAGDVDLALAAYNAGMGSVDLFNGIPPFKETRQYIQRVKTYYDEYKTKADAPDADDTSDAPLPDTSSMETLQLTKPIQIRV
jgi:hypothetical protein